MTRGQYNNLRIDYSLSASGNYYHTPYHVSSSQHRVTSSQHHVTSSQYHVTSSQQHVTSPCYQYHDLSPCNNVTSPVYQEIPSPFDKSPLYFQIPSPEFEKEPGQTSPLSLKLRSDVPKYFTFLSAQVSVSQSES